MIVAAPAYVSAAPGEALSIAVPGLVAGVAALAFTSQGSSATAEVDVAGQIDDAGNVAFVMPDGLADGPLAITDAAGNTASLAVSVRSQYVTSAEYTAAGEGADVSELAPGELDRILRRASSYAEGFIGYPLRLLPNVAESHTWKGPGERNRPMTRVYLNRWPCVSLDAFVVRISNTQYASFAPSDVVVNNGQRYIEILSYAVASFTLLGSISNLGLVANIVEVSYVSGFPLWQYPPNLKEAVTMIATELLDYRAIQDKGFGGLSRVREGQVQYDRRNEPFAVPQPALELLRPLVPRIVR